MGATEMPHENIQSERSIPSAPSAEMAARLCGKAQIEPWGLAAATFARALGRSAARRFAEGPSPQPQELERYLESLYLEDLALACACGEGIDAAWQEFMQRYREPLYAGARAIVGAQGEAVARELADSLYAELYGVGRNPSASALPEAKRRPLFDYYHGRSRLVTWLRAILAQRYVDRWRASARWAPEEEAAQPTRALHKNSAGARPELSAERARYAKLIQEACEAALVTLEARDRLALGLYYVKDKTMAEIGQILAEHEATVSRRLARTRSFLRVNTEERLLAQGLDAAQIELCFDCALQDGPLDLSRTLGGEVDASARAENAPTRPAPESGVPRILANPLDEKS